MIVHLIHDKTVRPKTRTAYNYKNFAAQVQADGRNFVEENLLAKEENVCIDDCFTVTEGRNSFNIISNTSSFDCALKHFVEIIGDYLKVNINMHTVLMGHGAFDSDATIAVDILKACKFNNINFIVHTCGML